ncbi:MAG: phosphate acyltransferase PlsX [Methylococcales bacterium]|jgi:phosphate acyltransferase|nr:phosphate acyltransferase PlsX [Methylococcales bacterium]MBT7411271.1 phosphate acyltransferase PlsX [Methylococcales bacterium]
MTITIAIDAMGGDHGIDVVIPATLKMLQQEPSLKIILTGAEDLLSKKLGKNLKQFSNQLQIKNATQIVEMDDLVSHALRSKKDSSMRVAINLVKHGEADACVSAGNTGALLATARFVLKTIPGIDRPAITTAVPCIGGYTHMLDLGANIDCEPEHLFQFAVMGTELVKTIYNINNPKVGLLNIGEEEIKGNEQIKKAATIISESPLNYVGFIEGDDIYQGKADVVVSDGFIGNIALKSSEGVAKMVNQLIKDAFYTNVFTKFAGLIAMPVMRSFREKIDPRRYNGASLLGLQGIVIKSHGSADVVAYANAIKIGMLEVEKAVPSQIGQQVERLLTKEAMK